MERDNSFCLYEIGVNAGIRVYAPKGKTGEVHVMLTVEPRGKGFENQLERIYKAFEWMQADELACMQGYRPVFLRYFLSDATNQAHFIRKEESCAVSIIQQPPLDGSKVAVWGYFVECLEISEISEISENEKSMTTVFSHNGYKHLWSMGMTAPEGDSARQTTMLLESYEDMLKTFGATIAANCQRTWFFVRDVDTNYAGLVKARRDNFTAQGLTADTHYIASTGIGGSPADTKALVQMGCYALTGHRPEQITYLYAPTHLNPTYEYGVTFERGVKIDFGDRSHIYISGTASINNKGEVMHVGNIAKQAERMCENVGTLLAEAGAVATDVMQIIVYLRDIADYKKAREIVSAHYPFVPAVYTLAPVCRPAWLIEMECVAIRDNKADFQEF